MDERFYKVDGYYLFFANLRNRDDTVRALPKAIKRRGMSIQLYGDMNGFELRTRDSKHGKKMWKYISEMDIEGFELFNVRNEVVIGVLVNEPVQGYFMLHFPEHYSGRYVFSYLSELMKSTTYKKPKYHDDTQKYVGAMLPSDTNTPWVEIRFPKNMSLPTILPARRSKPRAASKTKLCIGTSENHS